jgi:hypothetical protein
MLAYIRRLSTLDTRAQALFRIIAAFAWCYDLFDRLGHFSWYTDDGVVQRADAIVSDSFEFGFSLFFANGSALWAAILFTVHFAVLFSLFIGFHSRLCAAMNMVLLVSLSGRSDLLLSYGDQIGRLYCFAMVNKQIMSSFWHKISHAVMI